MTILFSKEITVSPMLQEEKNNASSCSTRSQVAARLALLNLNFTVLSKEEEEDDALDPFKLQV